MQLMTFNSLLMFDIVFIFFLFLVCVTCLVYYLPPRELSPAHPPLAEDDVEHCHDHCHHHHLYHLHHQYHHLGAACCEGTAGPLVRECAAAARRISGGGTPACSLPDLRELVVPEPNAPECTADAGDSSCANLGVLEFDAEHPEGGLCPLRASPPILDHRQDYRQPPMVRDDGVLLLDCTLEDILPLCPRASSPRECADDPQRSPSASEVLRRTSGPHFLPDYIDEPYHNGSYQQQQQQNFCPSCTYACYQQHRHSVSPTVRQCHPPSPAVVNYHRTLGRPDEHDAPFVAIEIERYDGTAGGDRGRRGSGNTGAGNIEVPPPAAPLALPACCYVRAKTSDIKECTGPIHDV